MEENAKAFAVVVANPMAPPIAARNNSLRFMIDEDCLIMIKFATTRIQEVQLAVSWLIVVSLC